MADFFADRGPRELAVLSWPLPQDVKPAAWLAAHESSNSGNLPACWPAPAQMEQTTIDGRPAWIHGGLHACGFTEAVVFVDGRVYLFGALMDNQQIFDRTLFDTILGSVRFDP